jgi:DNA polymerase/3'-5' exonuclease PolX
MNSIIIKQFTLLLKQIQIDMNKSTGIEYTKNSFRLSNTFKILKILKSLTKQITLDDIDLIKNISGIGKGTIKRIEEILKTGKLSEIKYQPNNSQYLESISNLIKIFGIGKKKANELIVKYNIHNINDLVKLIKNKKIELPENIIKGLKYVNKTKTNIPRKEIDEIYIYLIKKIQEVDKNLNLYICGSYRRLKPTSNDIDIIIYHNKLIKKKETENSNIMKTFIQTLIDDKFIIDNYTSLNVPTKFMGLCKKKRHIRRIDIRMIPLESLHYATLYFTGSGDFNKKMRKNAMNLGYILNEYGLYFIDSKKLVKSMKYINSEKDIFEILNMEYLPPHLRE